MKKKFNYKTTQRMCGKRVKTILRKMVEIQRLKGNADSKNKNGIIIQKRKKNKRSGNKIEAGEDSNLPKL
jgi:hypothetical protein